MNINCDNYASHYDLWGERCAQRSGVKNMFIREWFNFKGYDNIDLIKMEQKII